MRMSPASTVVLMLLAANVAVAAEPTTVPVDAAAALAACRRDAQACVGAFSRGDAGGLLASMHPAVFKLGNADLAQVKNALDLTFAGFKEQGLSVTCSIGDGPGELIAGGEQRFAIVKEFVDFRREGREAQRMESYLLGVSDDGGRTWRFVDGQGLNAETIAKVFPNYPIAAHPLPVVGPPKLTPIDDPAPVAATQPTP